MRQSISTTARLIALMVLASGVAHGQEARTGGGNASAALLQQLQQLGAERTDLQSQNAKLQKDLDAMRKERDALKSAQEGLARRAGASEAAVRQAQQGVAAQRQSDDQEIARLKDQLQQLVGKFRDTVTTLQGVETERSNVQAQLVRSTADFDKCANDNYAMSQIADEVLDRYSNQGAFSYMARGEPFTRIKHTQVENLVLEYRQKIDAERVRKDGAVAAPAAAGDTKDATAHRQ